MGERVDREGGSRENLGGDLKCVTCEAGVEGRRELGRGERTDERMDVE